MHKISFNVGEDYFTPLSGPKEHNANPHKDVEPTHWSFDDEDHLNEEYERIRELRTRGAFSPVRLKVNPQCEEEKIRRDWAIMRRIKKTYRLQRQRREDEIDDGVEIWDSDVVRRFVYYVDAEAHAFSLWSSESDLLSVKMNPGEGIKSPGRNPHYPRFSFASGLDLEREWSRIRDKMVDNWPHKRVKHTRFIEPSADMEWWIIDGIKQTYLCEMRRRRKEAMEKENEAEGLNDD